MNNKLPNNWIIKPLGEVVTTSKGKKPKNSGPPSDERTIPYINIKAFESGQPTEFAEPGGYTNCDRDNVLIVWDGARSGLIGRGISGYIGSTLARVDSEIADKGYLFYFLQSQYKHINTQTKGVGIPHVDPSIFKAIPFPIAPPEQQKRIVAEIEKQFSRLDEAVVNLKRVKANLKRYKAAVLKAAVEGKLTEKWREEHPNIEPASKLLDRILAERRRKWEEAEIAKMKAKGKVPKDDKWKKKRKEPERLDTTNLPELPGGWNWVSMESLIVWGPQNGLYLPKKDYKLGIAMLRIDDYQDGYSRNVENLQQVETTKENIERYGLDFNDFIINRVNSPSHLGKCIIVKERNLPSLFESNMMRMKLASDVITEYVELYLHSKPGKTRLIENAKWAVNQASINQGDVSNTAVPLPPQEEQNQIVKEVDRLLSIARETEAQVDTNLKRTKQLRQTILSFAFQGKQR